MSIDKQALREAALNASRGTWSYGNPHDYARGYEVKVGVNQICQNVNEANAKFIALANPATVWTLLDELELVAKSEWKIAGDLAEIQMNNTVLEIKLEAAEKRVAEMESLLSAIGKSRPGGAYFCKWDGKINEVLNNGK